MRKLGLSRDQLGFLTDHDQVDQVEQLFERSNEACYSVDGGASAVTTTIPAMNIGESTQAYYRASGGTRTVNLPTTGTFSFLSIVTVNNTATITPTTKVGHGVAGATSIVVAMAAGSTLYVSLTRTA